MEKTPKEKAIEIMDKMTMKDNAFDKKQIIACSLVCVDEILSDLGSYRMKPYLTIDQVIESQEYWIKVKNHLNN